jgi:polyvinyl alcohol dehydrogenase (cytochrome)
MNRSAWRPNELVLACVLALGAGAPLCLAADAPAEHRHSTEFGFGLFQQHCIGCHGNPAYERAPTPAVLRSMPPERIYDALTSGVMKQVGDTLTDAQRRLIAESVAGRLLGSAQRGDASAMPNRCASNPTLRDLGGPGWNGWGNGLDNNRFQSAAAAGLTAATVPGLKLKWAFGYPDGTSAFGQPTAVAGRIFVGTDTGFVYSLDADTGCVYWSFQSKAGVRNAMTLGPIRSAPGSSTKYAVFFGDLKANAYAIDAQTGKQIWTTRVESNFTTRVTAAPALYAGRLYVPVSAWEGFSARVVDYPCCKAVGSVSALDANTGKVLWKTYTIARRPRPTHRNSKGVQQWGPAGVPVWNTPTVDPKRHALYVGTGDASTYPAPATSDAILALAVDTGKVLWSRQIYHDDSFLVGCSGGPTMTENCPKVQGPDWDVPMSPMLKDLQDGRSVLVFGTKPGDIVALNPDDHGAQLWRVDVLGDEIAGDRKLDPTRGNRGPLWGGAIDGQFAFFGLNAGGVASMRIADGHRQWYTPLNSTSKARVTHSAAATAIPGVVFVGGSDGKLWALSSADGHSLWSFDTAHDFDTVNKVPAHGGSISAPGATVANGMLFIGSGYAVVADNPGNVLLAFSLH